MTQAGGIGARRREWVRAAPTGARPCPSIPRRRPRALSRGGAARVCLVVGLLLGLGSGPPPGTAATAALQGQVGSLTVLPTSGDPAAPGWSWSLPVTCPAPADRYRFVVAGPGIPADPTTAIGRVPAGAVVGQPTPLPAVGQAVVQGGSLLDTLLAALSGNQPAFGIHTLAVQCLAPDSGGGPVPTGDGFAARVDLSTPETYAVLPDTAAAREALVVAGVDPQPALAGRPLTLRADVVAASGGVPTGDVTLALVPGGPSVTVPLDPSGSAVATVTAPSAGVLTLRADYPGDALFAAASATASVVVVDPAAPIATTATLTITDPGDGTPVTFAGTVATQDGVLVPTGTCTFRQGDRLLASGVSVDTTGVCRFSPGSLTTDDPLTVEYLPNGPFAGSTSEPVSAPSSLAPAAETEVSGVAISTPYTADRPPTVGVAQLDATATSWRAVLPLGGQDGTDGIRIIDNRPGRNEFSVVLAATDHPDDIQSERLPPSSLSVEASSVSYLPGNRWDGLTPETTVTVSDIASFAPGSQVWATAVGPGEAVLNGDLVVSLPTSVAPGTYSTIITFTCIAGPPVEVTDLSLDKTSLPADGATVRPGDEVTWTITVVNVGASPAEVEVVDDVPVHVRVTDPGGGQVTDDGGLRWLVSLAPAETVTLTYTGVVVDEAPAGGELINIVTIPVAGLSDSTRHPIAASPPTTSTSTTAATSPATSAATTTGTTTTGTTTTGTTTTGTTTTPLTSDPLPSRPSGPLSRTGVEVLSVLLLAAAAIGGGLTLVLITLRRSGRGRRQR